MRSLQIVACAVVCLSLVAGVANAAGSGQVPNATLASFGLGGMQHMTDLQGSDIRAGSFAFVLGGGTVNYFAGQINLVGSSHAPAGFVVVPISGGFVAVGGFAMRH